MRSFHLAARSVKFAGLAVSAFALLLPFAVRAQRPLPDQDILKCLSETIAWYRDVATFVQTPAGPRERLFGDDLRDSSAQAVHLAFDFARAQAAIPGAKTPSQAPAASNRGRNLAEAEAAADQKAGEAQEEIDQINRQLQNASPRTRRTLLAQRDEVTAELNFAKVRRDAIRNLLGFLSAPNEGGLAAKISDLERSVPEITNPREKSSAAAASGAAAQTAQDFHPDSAGLVGLTTEIFSVSRKISRLNNLIKTTDDLRQANQKLRGPLRNALQEIIQNGNSIVQAPDATNVDALNAQRNQLDSLSAEFKRISGSAVPLSEQLTQINVSRGQMEEWRNTLDQEYASALRYLLLRVGMLAIGILAILGLSELWRRATVRYVHDLRRRRQFLLLRRIVVACTIVLFLVMSFVTEFGSLATFAGFSAAGLAVAMQSVIVSAVAYFFLVGRWGVRVGDRVTVSGVTGDVVDIGLFRLYLMELGGSEPTLEPTGRIVVFPNAVFFQPSAMFKQFPGLNYTWRTLTVRLVGTVDSAQAEKRLLGAVEAIYAEYRESIERQYQAVQSSLNLHTPEPRLESRVRFSDSNLEIAIRYPVETSQARDLDDRISRAVIHEIESEPDFKSLNGGAPKLEMKAG
jgi:small-conductance mechanosensitive channel